MKFFLVFLAILPLSVLGADIWHSDKIDWVYPQANGSVALKFKGSSSDCSNSSGYHYVTVGENGVTQEALDQMYSLALLAASTGKSLAVNFDTGSSECFVNRMYVQF